MKYLGAIYSQLSDKFGRISRKIWRNRYERSNLKNTDFTIFSQNCIGGIMSHDLGLQFRSPTVNLLFKPSEFITFMENIHYYLNQEIEFQITDARYPVGSIGSGGANQDKIEIRFLHYQSEKEANDAWIKRKKRINWNNIFVICCDEGLTHDDMVRYDNLPYKNKILFTSKQQLDIRCAVYCKEYKEDCTDARLLNFANPLGKRFYQKYIDYVKWLNNGGI